MIVSIHNLTKKFGKVTAVDGLNLDIEQGEIFGLVGPDGAGKTTAIRLMLGILRPDSGTGKIGAYDLRKEAESISTLTGYVSQRFSLYGELTVEENLALFADLYRVSAADLLPRVQRLMQFSRLDPFRDRLAANLSGGMKQKLALSCALIHTPKILFLDEPTTGVDPLSRRDLWRLLFDLWQEGVTIVVSTPYMDEAERCSRVGFLSHGKLIALGRPDDLRDRFQGVIYEVVADEKFGAPEKLSVFPFVRDVNLFGEGLHVIVDEEAVESAEAALRGAPIGVRSIRRVPPTMEDVFFQLTQPSPSGRGRASDSERG
ncbi:MAG: ABC transporter ATP-binding protein [Acidobacteria bacterium]|nr:ABC transporter ATP-binding protein [Acidobacteriota bacterium]